METIETKTNGVVILGLKGKLDASTAPQLQERLLSAMGGGDKQFAIDCAQLDYISSAGLRVLILTAKQLRNVGGRMVLYALQSHVKEVFELAGLFTVLPMADSQAEALSSFKKPELP